MINSCLYTQQDTIQNRNVVLRDSLRLQSDSTSTGLQPDSTSTVLITDSTSIRLISDSISLINVLQPQDSVINKSALIRTPSRIILTDTTSVCSRNSLIDITFYDSNNVVTSMELESSNRFPFTYTAKNSQMQIKARTSLVKHLKSGKSLPSQPFHNDWMIGILLIVALIYSLIRTTSKRVLSGVRRFFLFRGINEPTSRDVDGFFHWQSTILNLNSFFIISLFAYCAAFYYDFIPAGISGIFFWLISMGIIISAVTLRHIVCLIAGNISGEKEVFREYLIGVYQFYRFSALFLFVLVILIFYTVLFPVTISFISGIIVLGIMYIIRVSRLIIIFLNRKISIFYLILYLCALEILPVLILIKYFTGLI